MGPAMRVVLIDDVTTNLMILRAVVSRVGECEIVSFTDPVKALADVVEAGADLVMVDYHMPGMNGIRFIQSARTIPGCEEIPIVMVTTSDEREVRLAALDAGATDFLTKPIDVAEVTSRVRNMLRLRDSQKKLADKAAWLEAEVRKATSALAQREEEIILRLSRASEHRDTETGFHILRMARYCRLIAESLGLGETECHDIYLAAPMHDVGKIAVNDAILLKPGLLTPAERLSMQEHTTSGYEILAGSDSELIQLAAEIARCHHERWDGTGYPRGLSGTAIPLYARIAAVADVFDALTSERPYKRAWSPDEARAYIRENSGTQFDPDCVTAFLARWDDALAICGAERAETVPPLSLSA